MKNFKIGDTVKYSDFYFEYMVEVLEKLKATKKQISQFKKLEKKLVFKVVEIPAKHGTANSIGISPIDDDSEIYACTKKEIVLLS